MTMEELVKLLSRDRELDVSLFGKKGFRSLSDLLTEINDGDVTLEFNEQLGRIILFRFSIWGLLETEDGYSLIETARWRPKERLFGIFRRWRRIEKIKEYSISETRRREDESDVDALLRGIREEWQLFISKEKFNPEFINETSHPLAESSVYPKLLTLRHSKTYKFTLPKRPMLWDPIAIDKEGGDIILMFLSWIYTGKNERRHQKVLHQFLTLYNKYSVLWIRKLF